SSKNKVLLSRPLFIRIARAGAERTSLISLAQLAARTATLQSRFIGAQSGASIDGEYALDFCVRAWNNVDTDQFSNSSRRSRACISRRLHSADVTTHEDRHVACADVLLPEQLHIRCFNHRIGGLNCTHESFGLNHSECFKGHLFVLTLVSIVDIKSDCIGSCGLNVPPRAARS